MLISQGCREQGVPNRGIITHVVISSTWVHLAQSFRLSQIFTPIVVRTQKSDWKNRFILALLVCVIMMPIRMMLPNSWYNDNPLPQAYPTAWLQCRWERGWSSPFRQVVPRSPYCERTASCILCAVGRVSSSPAPSASLRPFRCAFFNGI